MGKISYEKFKHGQRVTFVLQGKKITDARISIGKGVKTKDCIFLCQNEIEGMFCEELFGFKYSYCLLGKGDAYFGSFILIKNLTILDRTIEDVEEGDVLIDNRNEKQERVVLGVCGSVVHLSAVKKPDMLCSSYTKQQLRKDDFTIKQDSPTEGILEITADEALEELAKVRGVDVSTLRIKK